MFKTVLKESVNVSGSGGDPARHLLLSIANDFEDSKWRVQRFHEFIWNNIAQTALSESERNALIDSPQTLLNRAASNLRLTDSAKDIGSGSELAEAVLYGVMHAYYGGLPVVPKIFYKQNVQDNAKGADSVHVTLDGDTFRLWFGESKFYSNIEDARLAAIVKSVGDSLKADKLKKENSIICSVSDLSACISDQVILEKIRKLLSQDVSLDELKPHLSIPILLLHECALTSGASVWSKEYEQSLIDHHRDRALSYFKRQLGQLSSSISLYGEITFHVILIPVPSKGKIVEKFLATAKFHKECGDE